MNKVHPEISRVRDQSLFSWGFHCSALGTLDSLKPLLLHHPSCPAQPSLHIYRKWSVGVCIRVEFPLTQLSYSPSSSNGKEQSRLPTLRYRGALKALLRWELHISQVFSFVSAAAVLFLVGGCGC